MTFKKSLDKISHAVFGDDPVSSMAGYLMGALIAVTPFLADEFISTKRLVWIGICSILVAVLGRITNRKKPRRRRTPVEDDPRYYDN
jgi:hypothetical protein